MLPSNVNKIKEAAKLLNLELPKLKLNALNNSDVLYLTDKLRDMHMVAENAAENINLLCRHYKSLLNNLSKLTTKRAKTNLIGGYMERNPKIRMRRYADGSRANFVLILSPPNDRGERRPARLQCCLFIAAYHAAVEEYGTNRMIEMGFPSPWSIFLALYENGVLNDLSPNSMPEREHVTAIATLLQIKISVTLIDRNKDNEICYNSDPEIGEGEHTIHLHLYKNHYLNPNDGL